jgi:hypothetical protein
MVEALETELQTFEEHREELVGTSNGKFVLIRGTEVLGTFDTQADALAEGYKTLGNVPFLVRHIQAVDTPLNFVSGLVRT